VALTAGLRRNDHPLSLKVLGGTMIILGIILLVIGFVAHISILWTIGIIVLVIGAILAIAGFAGREIGGRRHYY
jgi:uncharacterized membrane protein HdeD (DUF308 family)